MGEGSCAEKNFRRKWQWGGMERRHYVLNKHYEGKEWAELGKLMDEARSDVSEYVYFVAKMKQMGK